MSSNLARCNFAMMQRLGQTEQVIYRPAHERPREITAVVTRDAPIQQMPQAMVFGTHVTVLNDELIGISSARADIGADRLAVAERIGTKPVSRSIQRIVSQDADYLELEVS